MLALRATLVLILLVFAAGCSNPADNVPAATVNSRTNGAAAKTIETEGRAFSFSSANSTIEFVGSKVTGSHKGGFKTFQGEFRVAGDNLADSGNRIVIDMNSIYTDTERLTGHLKTPDFFDVARFPTATFTSTRIEKTATNHTVHGDLNLHGVTRQISFPASLRVSANEVQVQSEFFINRFDFDIKYPGKANDLIRQQVVLNLKIKAAPGKANFESIQPAR